MHDRRAQRPRRRCDPRGNRPRRAAATFVVPGWVLFGALGCGAPATDGSDARPDATRATDAPSSPREAGLLESGPFTDGALRDGALTDGALDAAARSADGGARGPTTDAAGPSCEPPHGRVIDGVCVPSCGGAGGNTCVPADSTLCEGLPAADG